MCARVHVCAHVGRVRVAARRRLYRATHGSSSLCSASSNRPPSPPLLPPSRFLSEPPGRRRIAVVCLSMSRRYCHPRALVYPFHRSVTCGHVPSCRARLLCDARARVVCAAPRVYVWVGGACVRRASGAKRVTQVNATRSSRTDSRVATECCSSALRGISRAPPCDRSHSPASARGRLARRRSNAEFTRFLGAMKGQVEIFKSP